MKIRYYFWLLLHLLLFIILSCSNDKSFPPNPINNSFPKEQVELRKVVRAIVKDAMTANIEGLQTAHLVSDKFTKFGPRNFKRQDVNSTNESEAKFFSSISNLNLEIKELKIDVFGDFGIATYYPHFTFEKDGEMKSGSSRQTLVFLSTDDGWKIVHEHGTPKIL